MSDTEPRSETAGKSRYRLRWFIRAACILWSLAFLVPQMMWAIRPGCYTFVSKGRLDSPPIALSLQVPYGWTCQETDADSRGVFVEVRRIPLTGVARWWSEHVPHRDPGHTAGDLYVIGLEKVEHCPTCVTDDEETEADTARGSGYQVTERTFKHPLGTAHACMSVWRFASPPPNGLNALEITEVILRSDVSAAAVHQHYGPEYHVNEPIWNEIVNSIGVVQK